MSRVPTIAISVGSASTPATPALTARSMRQRIQPAWCFQVLSRTGCAGSFMATPGRAGNGTARGDPGGRRVNRRKFARLLVADQLNRLTLFARGLRVSPDGRSAVDTEQSPVEAGRFA